MIHGLSLLRELENYMKKIYVFVLIIFLAISVYSFYAYNNEKDIEQDKEITVILAVNSNIVKPIVRY